MICTPDNHWALFLRGCDFCLVCGKRLGTGPSGDTKTIGRSLEPSDAVRSVLGSDAAVSLGDRQWSALMDILAAVLAQGGDRDDELGARREVLSILRTQEAPVPDGWSWMS